MTQPLPIHLKTAGLIASLPGDLPLQNVIDVADALLASPVLTVEVVLAGNDTAVVHDLCQRAGRKMVVGARVETQAAATAALAAGAHFVTTLTWNTAVWETCRQQQTAYLPGIISLMAAEEAQKRGCTLIRLRTGGPDGPAYVTAVRQAQPQLSLVVDAPVNEKTIGAYSRAGATAVFVGEAIFTHPTQPMADIITRARRLQKAWDHHTAGDARFRQNGTPPYEH